MYIYIFKLNLKKMFSQFPDISKKNITPFLS